MGAIIAPFGVLTKYHHQILGKYIELATVPRADSGLTSCYQHSVRPESALSTVLVQYIFLVFDDDTSY